MKQEEVSFVSGGLRIAGMLTAPEGAGTTRRPAILILHGFGGHRNGPQQKWSRKFFDELGYVTLSIDFRGCGDSEGKRGAIVPFGMVDDAIAAVAWLRSRPEVDPARVALSGTSYGATVAVYAAGICPDICAVIAQGGWANGEDMFRRIHNTPDKWARFSQLLVEARRNDDPTRTVPRYEIIWIPDRLRQNIDGKSIMDFAIETIPNTLEFNAGDVAARIAPRPLLIIHSAKDEVITADGSIDLFRKAGYHGDLHILNGVDHFMFEEEDGRVASIVKNWLAKALPVAR